MTKENVRKLISHAYLSLFFFVILCGSVYAGGGKLTGRVMDSKTREPLISANVVITSIFQNGKEVQLPVPLGARTDQDGYYVILNIPSGEYTVRASVISYATLTVRNIKIDPDRTINYSFELEPSSLEINEVVVTAKKEIMKTDVSTTQEVIGAERLESLPVVRVDEFIGKLKGIQLSSSSDGYGLVVRGGAIRETDIRMDGVSLQDPRSGNSYLGFNSTSIEEIQVMTGGFEAKYGGFRSGMLNVKTKDGSRDRFTASIKTDYTPEGQYRFFGTNPYSNDSWVYKIYAGEYAFTGVPEGVEVPTDLQNFKGWNKTVSPSTRALDSLQRYELWKLQHPQYSVAQRPDVNIQGTFTGPFVIPSTTFMLGFKYENSQFAFPLGPRDNYEDWNTQIKLTTSIPKMKFSVNAMYAKVYSNTTGQNISYDASQRFAYMNNNTPSAISNQASQIAGQSILQMFNKSRFQEFEQTFMMGGAKFTYTPKQNLFYSIDFQMGYTGQDISPMLMDMAQDSSQNYYYMYSARAKKWYQYYNPTMGLPNGSTNPTTDGMEKFYVYGGHQWADSSYSYNYQLKGEMTWQANRFNEIQAGFNVGVQRINVYAGMWNQSNLAFTPNSWQYFKATPLDIGLFVQDKLEFEGMVLNVGLRGDYFNPFRDGYEAGFPADKDYSKFYTDVYSSLDGTYNSYERWLLFRELLDNPPGWPSASTKGQFKISPRLGVSFPLTESSKMYFNYGHFYQRPAASILYNMKLNAGSTTIPTPELDMARTVSYEFGFEQVFLRNFLLNITSYYKDVSNEPMTRTYINYYENNQIVKYFPDLYKDIKGVELRFERNSGRFITFSAMYDYMITSQGYAGLSTIYENMVKYRENAMRTASQDAPKPKPRATVNLDLHTPNDYGLFLGNWIANFFFEWKDGGEINLNSDQKLVKYQQWIEAVDYWNIDFRLSKEFNIVNSDFEISVTVKNLTNNKFLNTSNLSVAESDAYLDALKSGGGKYGEYKPEHLAKIFKNSWEPVLFQNPRRIIIGARVNL